MKYLFLLFVLSFALTGCVSTDFEVLASAEQMQTQKNSISSVVSNKKNTVMVKVDSFINGKYDYPALLVGVINNQSEDIELYLSDIQVLANGEQVDIVDPASLEKERNHRLVVLNRPGVMRGHRSVVVGQKGDRVANATHQNARTANQHITNKYKHFIHTQLQDSVVEPEGFYGGYISLNAESND